jgi:hypothetical protein
MPKKIKKVNSIGFLKKPIGKNLLDGTMKTLVKTSKIDKKGRIEIESDEED